MMVESGASVHPNVQLFIDETQSLCHPDKVVFCDVSQQEYNDLMAEMVASGMATPLNPALRPNCPLVEALCSANLKTDAFI